MICLEGVLQPKWAFKLKQRGDSNNTTANGEKYKSAASLRAWDQPSSVDFLPSIYKVPVSIPRNTSLPWRCGPPTQEVQAEGAGVQGRP